MLTIEQFRLLWQLLAALSSDTSIMREMSDDSISDIYGVMRICEKILEEN